MSPSDKPTRRDFLVTSSSVAIGAAIPLGNAESASSTEAADEKQTKSPYSSDELLRVGPQRTFTAEKATQVALPVGGIGAGCICFNGYGGLQDFSIRHQPTTT